MGAKGLFTRKMVPHEGCIPKRGKALSQGAYAALKEAQFQRREARKKKQKGGE